ncbi:MAG: phosphodiester glycosidase family protein, partial [Ignavibacteriaceae bacterium]|nr:phosphodiester glycosidase family protein [Ignavibacteriaceae bacterium]
TAVFVWVQISYKFEAPIFSKKNHNEIMKNILALLFLLSVSLFSQNITWSDITANHSTLPGGVKLFHGGRQSPALKIWYFDVDMNRSDIGIKAYKSKNIKEGITSFVPSYNAVAGINGGYFNTQTGASYSAVVTPDGVSAKNISSVVRDGKTYFLTRSLFGITDTREMAVDWIYHFGSNIKDIYRFDTPIPNQQGTPAPLPSPSTGEAYYELIVGIGGGPTLVKNGIKNITYNEEVFWGSGVGLTNQDPRTAVGYTNENHVIMVVADGRQTASSGLSLTELADVMINLGCIEAMNLDGGGSSQIAVGSTLINLPEGGTFQREIPTMLAIVKNDSVPYLPPVFYRKVEDTGDAVVSTVGDWSPSNIAGYWGNTPALKASQGSGESYAAFKPNLPGAGTYSIYGWWTSASDRCSDTPFIINHNGFVDTVRVDQTEGRFKWNLIGSFNFSGGSNESVTISNAANTPGYVIADAIRYLSFDSIAVGVKEQLDHGIKLNFRLEQNYPNPFNPSTKIRYTVPTSPLTPLLTKARGTGEVDVKLKVFNVLGIEIASLVNEQKLPGTYEIIFNSGSLASGVYFYKLTAENYFEVKKMVLMR